MKIMFYNYDTVMCLKEDFYSKRKWIFFNFPIPSFLFFQIWRPVHTPPTTPPHMRHLYCVMHVIHVPRCISFILFINITTDLTSQLINHSRKLVPNREGMCTLIIIRFMLASLQLSKSSIKFWLPDHFNGIPTSVDDKQESESHPVYDQPI